MKTLILLHGATGSGAQMQPLREALGNSYDVHTLHFPGHGGTPCDDDFSIPVFADAIVDLMTENHLPQASLFGYSMGGYVGLYLAKTRPELIEKVITLGTKFHWDPAIAEKETAWLQPQLIEQKVPKFAKALAALHGPNEWKKVLQKTAALLQGLGTHNILQPEFLKEITSPALLLRGDRDAMVSLEETAGTCKNLPHAQLGVLPGTPHPLDKADMDVLCLLIQKFLG